MVYFRATSQHLGMGRSARIPSGSGKEAAMLDLCGSEVWITRESGSTKRIDEVAGEQA